MPNDGDVFVLVDVEVMVLLGNVKRNVLFVVWGLEKVKADVLVYLRTAICVVKTKTD